MNQTSETPVKTADGYERLMKAIAIRAMLDLAKGRGNNKFGARNFIQQNPDWVMWASRRPITSIQWLLAEYQ